MEHPQESIGQPNAGQFESVLNLNYCTRDKLMFNLNRLTIFLECEEAIPDDAKERICKTIDESILLLAKLSSFGPAKSAEPSNVFEDSVSGQLIVELSRAERSRVVDHLMIAREAVAFDGSIKTENKRSLVTENKRIICQLVGLQNSEKSDSTGISGSAGDTSENNAKPALKKKKGRSHCLMSSGNDQADNCV